MLSFCHHQSWVIDIGCLHGCFQGGSVPVSASQSREVGNGNCGKEGVLVQVILGNAPEKLRKLRGLTQWKTVSCWCAVTSAESGRMPPCAALQEPSCLRPCPPQRCLPRPPTATSSWQTVRKRRWDCTQEGETAPVLLPMFQATVVTRPTVIERGSRIDPSITKCIKISHCGSIFVHLSL